MLYSDILNNRFKIYSLTFIFSFFRYSERGISLFKYSNLFFTTMDSNLYSDFQLGMIQTETEKAYFTSIFKLTDDPVWIPKSVVEPKTMKLKKWFINQLQHELKTNKQTTLAEYFSTK